MENYYRCITRIPDTTTVYPDNTLADAPLVVNTEDVHFVLPSPTTKYKLVVTGYRVDGSIETIERSIVSIYTPITFVLVEPLTSVIMEIVAIK